MRGLHQDPDRACSAGPGAGLQNLGSASYVCRMNLALTLSGLLACSGLAVSPAAAIQEQPSGAESDSPSMGAGQPLDEGTVAGGGSGKAIPGEILVKFEEGVSPEQIETITRRLGATVVDTMLDGRLVLVTTPYENATSQIIDAYAATEGVEYAEPNREVSLYPPPDEDGGSPPEAEDPNRGGGLPPPNEDGSAPLVPLPGPN